MSRGRCARRLAPTRSQPELALPSLLRRQASIQPVLPPRLAQASQPEFSGVDYLGVSPVFATPTKTDTSAPWGLSGLRQLRAATGLPLVAIGGIHAGNATDVLAAGADGLAVVSAICGAADPAQATRELLTLWEQDHDRK